MRTASSSSSAAITDSTGPKISSCAITDLLSTLPNTVGSTYQPRSRSLGRPPPVASVAPVSTPLAIEPSTRVRCRSAASGPIWLTGSNGSPTLTLENAEASASTMSSWRLLVTTILVSEAQT